MTCLYRGRNFWPLRTHWKPVRLAVCGSVFGGSQDQIYSPEYLQTSYRLTSSTGLVVLVHPVQEVRHFHDACPEAVGPMVLSISALVCWRCHLCEQWSLTNPRGKWHLLVVMHTSTALVRGPEDQDQASRGSHAREGGTGNHWSSLVACSGFPPQWAVIPWKWLSALNGGSAACDFAPGLSRTQRKNVWLNSLQARAIVLSPAGHWVTWRASKRTDIQAPVGFLMCLSGA